MLYGIDGELKDITEPDFTSWFVVVGNNCSGCCCCCCYCCRVKNGIVGLVDPAFLLLTRNSPGIGGRGRFACDGPDISGVKARPFDYCYYYYCIVAVELSIVIDCELCYADCGEELIKGYYA